MIRTTSFFFFKDTATTEIYTLSLHDALPIYAGDTRGGDVDSVADAPDDEVADLHPAGEALGPGGRPDRKSTRLNSSHANISYAVFCLKKKIRLSPFDRVPSYSPVPHLCRAQT